MLLKYIQKDGNKPQIIILNHLTLFKLVSLKQDCNKNINKGEAVISSKK